MIFNNNLMIIIASALSMIVLITVFITIKSRKRHQVSTSLSIDFLESLIQALGAISNIKAVSSEHQRIKLVLYDLKLVSSEKLKNLGTPAFLKGKELTLLVKHHTKDVIDYINTLKREGN